MIETDFVRKMLNSFFSDKKREFVVHLKNELPAPSTARDSEISNADGCFGEMPETNFTTGECASNFR